MSIGSIIKKARLNKNIKQSTIATNIGITIQTYIKWENDETEPKASQIEKLSKTLGIPSSAICNGIEPKKIELTDFMRIFSRINSKASDFEVGISVWETIEDDETFLKKFRKNAGIPEFEFDYIKYDEKREEDVFYKFTEHGTEVEAKDPLWD